MKTLLLTLGLLAGCGHTMMRGTVVMKTSGTEAHVCLGADEVRVGDRVHLMRKDCSKASKPVQCGQVAVTDGEVERILNDHYSVVRFPAGTAFAEGDRIEVAR